MQAYEAQRATKAAMAITSSLGLIAHDAAVLHNSNKLTLRLQPCDVLARAHHQLGDHPQAAEAYRRSVALFRRLGDRYFEADALRHLAEAYLAANDPGSARAAWQQALEILVELAVPDAEHVRAALGALGRVPVHP